MSNGLPKKRSTPRSESTRALMKERALERGQFRSKKIRILVRDAMKTIRKEIDGNEGIYPHNKGALSSAELARRAKVHPTTLFSPKQRNFGARVKRWLEALKSRIVVGRGPVRRELATRIADWKLLFDGLRQSHRDTELELKHVKGELTKIRVVVEELQRDKERLQLLVAASINKVVSLHPPKD